MATGFSHPKCYANRLADCCTDITREHYLSESILEDYDGHLLATREQLGWDKRRISPAAMTAKILCARHNNALSPLDTAGRDLFRALREPVVRAEQGGGVVALSGIDVERFMLKVLCGYVRLDGDDVPLQWQRWLFGLDLMRKPFGLHLNVREGDCLGGGDELFIFETSVSGQTEERTGCAITVHGYRLLLSTDGRPVMHESDIGKQWVQRPGKIRWPSTDKRHWFNLKLLWP